MKIDATCFDESRLKSNFRVALCSVPVEGWGAPLDRARSEGSLGIVPKVAIVALVKWMEKHGYTSDNWDFFDIDMLYPTDEEIKKYFSIYKPHVVGLSAVVSTSYTQVKRLSHLIRDVSPDTLIVMGGNLAASSEAVLVNTDTDLTIVGDGEIAWVSLLDLAKNNSNIRDLNLYASIPGICYLENKSLTFSSYGQSVGAKDMFLPDYDILQQGLRFNPDSIWNYFRPGKLSGWFDMDERSKDHNRPPNIAGIFASKGCVAKCTFCQRSTKGYRVQPYEDLDEHLLYLKQKFNVGYIQILDENFGSNKKHSYEFAKILNKHNMLWMATGVRCTSISEEDVIFYKNHGCSALKFGVESGSQLILDMMEKVFVLDDVYGALHHCTKHKVYSPLAVMVGMPGETLDTAKETGVLIGRVAASMNIHPKVMGYDIFYALPLPGTPLYEYGEYVGVIDKTPQGSGRYLERVTDAGTYKRYYVNLNGAHISEVLFWDVLVGLEASRTFHRLQGNPSILINDFNTELTKSRESELKNNSRWTLKYRALKFTFFTWFIDTYVLGNRCIDKIPRVIVYPVVKFMLYIEFLVQRKISFNTNNNIFVMDGSKIKRLSLHDLFGKSSKSKSLRGIVNRAESGDFQINKERGVSKVDISLLSGRKLLSKGL